MPAEKKQKREARSTKSAVLQKEHCTFSAPRHVGIRGQNTSPKDVLLLEDWACSAPKGALHTWSEKKLFLFFLLYTSEAGSKKVLYFIYGNFFEQNKKTRHCSTQPYVCVDQIGQSHTRLNVLHADAVQRHNRPSGDQLA